jgi:hypothetical protein
MCAPASYQSGTQFLNLNVDGGQPMQDLLEGGDSRPVSVDPDAEHKIQRRGMPHAWSMEELLASCTDM